MNNTIIINRFNNIIEYLILMEINDWKYYKVLFLFEIIKLRKIGKKWDIKLKNGKINNDNDILSKVVKTL